MLLNLKYFANLYLIANAMATIIHNLIYTSMIQKLISWSRVTEVNDVATRVSGAFRAQGIADPYLAATFGSLDNANLELSKAIRRSKAESNLEEKDEVRDECTRSLYYLINGFTHHPAAAIAESAQLLLRVFNNYGISLTNESYATESALISSMLIEFQKPGYATHIANLSGCGELLQSLASAQTDFDQARIAYETEKAQDGMVANATEIKKEVVDLVNNQIMTYLQGMQQANPGTYSVLAATCAKVIAENNEQVRRRKQKPEPATPQPA
ncbi:MAG TPA: DUF6261 family protein [Prolixibacteraceae bacterium]|nr:DUF6261 family protein [Prolixibacteraceae bacterium]